MNYPDNELTYYLHDNIEEAQDILYDKYKYIIEVLISKYRRVFLALNIDFLTLNKCHNGLVSILLSNNLPTALIINYFFVFLWTIIINYG